MFKRKPWYVVYRWKIKSKPGTMEIVSISRDCKDIIEKFGIKDFYCHQYMRCFPSYVPYKEIIQDGYGYLIYNKKKLLKKEKEKLKELKCKK